MKFERKKTRSKIKPLNIFYSYTNYDNNILFELVEA